LSRTLGDRGLDAAIALTRGWTRIYTRQLDDATRETRHEQIESDLWESIEDDRRRGVDAGATAAQIVLRLALGVADDLAWRGEEASPHMVSRRIRWAAMAAMGAAAIAAIVMMTAGGPTSLPDVGSPVQALLRISPPPPPPPPPPPRR
jgi:hypothetical protein